ncbi:MAG: DNA-deoxyinosine glycosylase [Methanosarcinaceae archaeon]|nr:DNA-deoxyinosine glycosylase [Methanosarcinaceae archaeon]
MIRKTGLKKITNKNTTVLILGSLPSDESLRQQQYYAHPGNDFWRLISITIGQDINELEYDEKIRILQDNGIGLWDVFRECEREGSSDSNIINTQINDLSRLDQMIPKLELVCFNGKKAGEAEHMFKEMGYRTKILPSSSGANRSNMLDRAQKWKCLL